MTADAGRLASLAVAGRNAWLKDRGAFRQTLVNAEVPIVEMPDNDLGRREIPSPSGLAARLVWKRPSAWMSCRALVGHATVPLVRPHPLGFEDRLSWCSKPPIARTANFLSGMIRGESMPGMRSLAYAE